MSVEKLDWKELCRAASKEPDSENLMGLVSALLKALDEQEKRRRTLPQAVFSTSTNRS